MENLRYINKSMDKLFLLLKYIFRGEIPLSILKKRGLKVGSNFNMQDGCFIDPTHCWLISIGNNVTLAPNVKIFAHDASTKNILKYTRIGLVHIGNDVFIGAGAILLPGLSIGNSVIIGAGSVVTKNIPNNSVAAGNPAVIIGNTSDFLKRNEKLIKIMPKYDITWTFNGRISKSKKESMIKALKLGIGYVE